MDKTVFVCENCGSSKVQSKAWVDLNGKTPAIDFSLGEMEPVDGNWCNNCNRHCYITTQEEFKEKQEKLKEVMDE